MDDDLRLVTRIYRAIRELADDAPIDDRKCARIASLIAQSRHSVRLEALLEQQADRIHDMAAEDFVALLAGEADGQFASELAGRDTAVVT